jgi:hypothetical protein
MTMASSEDSTTLDFFWGFFLRLFFLGHGAGFSSSSDESGMGGVFFWGQRGWFFWDVARDFALHQTH